MMQTAGRGQASAFSWWLRTGRVPPVRSADGVELKFNPWHDPTNGQFTFSGTGQRDGAGGAGDRADRPNGRASRTLDLGALRSSRGSTTVGPTEPLGSQAAGAADKPSGKTPSEAGRGPIAGTRRDRPNAAVEFAAGLGEGLYGVAEDTVAGARAVLTTNPVTTVRKVGGSIAGMIDSAIAAEDVPARVQVSRAAEAVANASARDIGRATGSVVGNTALAAAPGAALAKVSAARHISKARPRETFAPSKMGWVKETINSKKDWKIYNDNATGGRPGQAPTLMRTMPDGSKRPVKFDGHEGGYMIDRKWSVSGKPRSVAQILRQSQVLREHRTVGTYEVPTEAKRIAALKVLKKLNVRNIKIRVVKP